MKTHDFAKHLSFMAKLLKDGPNVELEALNFLHMYDTQSSGASVENDEIPHALNMLVGLTNVNKQQWLSLIEEFGFNVDIRARDANRDIVGKLLNYLTVHPYERSRLVGKRSKRPIKASAELADALTLLLKK